MDDSIGTLLYILFMILAIGASIYKSNAKKKASMGRKQPRPPAFDFEKEVNYTIPDNMSMYIPGGTQTEIEVVPEQEVELETDKELEKEEVEEEGQAVFEKTKSAMISENLITQNEISNTEILKEKGINFDENSNPEEVFHFNLKRAVIFSEILNRKEF